MSEDLKGVNDRIVERVERLKSQQKRDAAGLMIIAALGVIFYIVLI